MIPNILVIFSSSVFSWFILIEIYTSLDTILYDTSFVTTNVITCLQSDTSDLWMYIFVVYMLHTAVKYATMLTSHFELPSWLSRKNDCKKSDSNSEIVGVVDMQYDMYL